jgi:glycosyltransferase involved in cell wall biosynthesis
MAVTFINCLKNLGWNLTLFDKSFSKELVDIGKYSIDKFVKIPIQILKLIFHLLENKHSCCIYFLSIHPPAIIFDAIMLFIIRKFGVDYILYLHAKGLQNLNEKLSGLLLATVMKAISDSLGALVLGDKLKEDVNYLIPNDRLFVIPNTVPESRHKWKEKKSNNKGPVKILFLSNLMPTKGPMEFIKMAKKVTMLNKDVHFFLAGLKLNEDFYNDIVKFVRNENLNRYITLTGPVYDEDKEKLYSKCDIFIYPTHEDAFGLVNLEAMRAGIPIISSDQGSIPEVVIDGLNGFIVNPKNVEMLVDRVFKLIDNEELRINMGNTGRKLYEKKYSPRAYQNNVKNALLYFLKTNR